MENFENLSNSNEKENKENNKEQTPERIALRIERHLMERSEMDSVQWTEHHAEEFRDFFDKNKDLVLKLYKEDPEGLYKLYKAVLDREEGD